MLPAPFKDGVFSPVFFVFFVQLSIALRLLRVGGKWGFSVISAQCVHAVILKLGEGGM